MTNPLEQEPKTFAFENSPLKDAYHLLSAQTPLELSRAYDSIDQQLMKTGSWDYANPELPVNKVKEILERASVGQLTDDEKEWRQEILWFWYHHAISSAIWLHKDREKAKEFAAQALDYQSEENPNKITRLLFLLVNDRLADAEAWAGSIVDEGEHETAAETIGEYKEGKFF
jgi:hypothetical protein